jgi:hypothetical protein
MLCDIVSWRNEGDSNKVFLAEEITSIMALHLRNESCIYTAILICDQNAWATNQKLVVLKLHVESLQSSAN